MPKTSISIDGKHIVDMNLSDPAATAREHQALVDRWIQGSRPSPAPKQAKAVAR